MTAALATAVTALTVLTGCATSTSTSTTSGAPSAPSSDASLSTRARPAATSAGCQRQPDVPTGSTSVQIIESGGQARAYLIHLPAGFQPNRPTPLVLAFHGRKGTGNDVEAFSGIDALDAIAVYPRGLAGPDGETAWQGAPENSGADDVRFVGTLLDRLESTLCVDQSRIFATGKSEGGGFTALLACRLPQRIAAFATVSGAFYPGTDAGCAGSPPVPLVDFHGTGDHVISYDGGVSHGERYPSMGDWLRRWAGHNRCSAADPTSTSIGSDVTELSWQGCAAGSALVHYRIAGGGHTWAGALTDSGPGVVTHTISATAVMWAFFQAHPLGQA
jgi:polyhydroxybutyrate depolymerase